MSNTTTITSPQKGMMLDLHNTTQQDGMYIYALNATLEQNTEDGFVIQNDSSNFLTIKFPEGFTVIGNLHIVEQERILFFLQGNNTSQIGEVVYKNVKHDTRPLATVRHSYCKNCGSFDLIEPKPLELINQIPSLSYKPIVESACLNFNKYYSIDAEYKISDCTIQIYFIDGLNKDRYMYFDYNTENPSQFISLQEQFIKDGILDCNRILLQPAISRPNIEAVDVFSGGNLKKGVYQFTAAYSTANGVPLTSYYGITQPIPIFTKSEEFDTNNETDQAIKVKVRNLTKHTSFQFYNLVVVETINNVSEYKLIATLPITQEYYTYSGRNDLPKLSVDDIIQKYPFYHHSNSITKSNEYLFRANLVEEEQLNLQRVANNIELEWQTVVLKEGDFKKSEIASKHRSSMRDEVYPYAIIFEIDGQDTPAFHIPGRNPTKFDRELLTGFATNDTVLDEDCNTVPNLERWRTYNTATIEAKPHVAYEECKESLWEYGKMSYWESTELYPNKPEIWGQLANTPIRHHKFPDSSVTHIHNNSPFNINIAEFDPNFTLDQIIAELAKRRVNYIYPIGVKVNNESIQKAINIAITEGVLTLEQSKRITGYRIVRGNRANDKTIKAKGYLFDMYNYVKDGNYYFYPNYPYNDLRPDPYIARNNFYKDKKIPYLNEFTNDGRYTFHSPDIHFVEPTVGNTLKLETLEYGKANGYFTKSLEHAEHKIISDKAYDMSSIFGAAIADATKINDQTEQEGSNLGASIGGAVGILGGPLGSAIGSVAGSLLGGLFANNMFGGYWKDVAEAMTRLSLALYNSDKLVTFFKFLIPPTNYNYQYNSVANYTSFLNVENEKGIKQREIINSSYLRPEISSVSENGSNVFINNYNRESSLYLKIKGTLPVPSIQDTSRFIMGSLLNCAAKDTNFNYVSTVSSYYASIKTNRLDQYGSIYNIDYLETNSQSYKLESQGYNLLFGGDVFINKFALKRKMPFFIANTFKLPENVDFYHSDFANAGYPVYYFNTQGDDDFYLNDPLSFFKVEKENNNSIGHLFENMNTVFGTDIDTRVSVPNMAKNLAVARRVKANLDCDNIDPVAWVAHKGVIYLYSYGIPSFFVESDINLDFRVAENDKEKDFYPRQQNLNYWLQEKNVPIKEDNYYLYNKTYSKQNKESFISINNALYEPNKVCRVTYPNRVIYSQQSSIIDSSNSKDSWLIYKANNKENFSKTNGRLISVEGLENSKVLVRFDKTSEVYNAYVTLKTSSDDVQVDSGGMFVTKPQEYAHTDLGYAGSQHKAILHTEFGHIFADAKRGQVFVLNTNGLEELSKEGMKNWFSKNLPFQINKDIPELPESMIDNSYAGIGLSLYYDRVYKRLFVTKLDYKVKKGVYFDTTKGFYFNDGSGSQAINLGDPKYFENISWTISYNFYTKTWVSFHSFKPNYAISGVDFFFTGLNNNTNKKGASSLWSHNVSNRSYQVYYGKKYPFIVETFTKPDGKQHNYQSVEYNADVYHYEKDQTKIRLSALPFNKMVVYTDRTNSGLLEGQIVSRNDIYSALQLPKYDLWSRQIQVKSKESNWRFNQFNNIAINNIPSWIQTIDKKELNPKGLVYTSNNSYAIRGEWCRVQLINDKWSNYKIIMKWLINNSIESFA